MVIVGIFFQGGLTGSAWDDWALYTDSPLRAYENETGCSQQSASGTRLVCQRPTFVYKRRREVESKPG